MDTIKIKRSDGIVTVYKSDYVTAKTKQLIEFGYNDLSESHVEKQLNLILAGKTELKQGLTVIGMIMIDDIVLYKPAKLSPSAEKPKGINKGSIHSVVAKPPTPKKRTKKGWEDEAHCIDGKCHHVVRTGNGLKCKLCNKRIKRSP